MYCLTSEYDWNRLCFPHFEHIQVAIYAHMHTLEQVLAFYNKGGGAGAGIMLHNQTLPPDPLHLTKKEIKSIVAFLKTLD